MTILFLNSSQKYPNQAFLVPNLRIFIFAPSSATRQIRGFKFPIWQKFFQVPLWKYANQAFSVPNLRIFILHQTLHLEKFESVDFKYDNGFFKLMSKNTQIKQFLSYRVWPTECRCFFQTDCLPNRLDFEQTVFIKLYTRISRIFPIIWFFLTIICFEWQYLKVRAKIISGPQNAGFFFQWYLQTGNRYLNRIFSVIF